MLALMIKSTIQKIVLISSNKKQVVILRRGILSNIAVLGTMILNGTELCKTLEKPWLNNLPNISGIPSGTYEVKKYNSDKFPDCWELQNVENRSYILIHAGNLVSHTEGCILVGNSWGFVGDQLAALNSRITMDSLRQKLKDCFTLKIENPC